LVENLNLLPLPARDLLCNNAYRYPLLGSNCTTMQTSRGCPFACAYYCPYPLVQGKKWRSMSPERVFREITDVVKKYRIKNILFRDATFTFNRERTIKICRKIISSKFKINWWCETRVNCLDEKLITLMKQAGCKGINIGVETGDSEVMKNQGKPGVNIEQLEKLKIQADKLAMKLHFLLLIGLPQETRNSLFLTFKLVKRLNPTSLGVTVVTPYPGTELYEEASKKGWIESRDWSKYSGGLPAMHTSNLSSLEIKLCQKLIIAEITFLQWKGIPGDLGLFIETLFFKVWSLI